MVQNQIFKNKFKLIISFPLCSFNRLMPFVDFSDLFSSIDLWGQPSKIA